MLANKEFPSILKTAGPRSILGWILFVGIIGFYVAIAIDLAIQLDPMALLCGGWVIVPIGTLAYLSKWWSALLIIPLAWLIAIPMQIACDMGGSGYFNLLHLSHGYAWTPMSFAGIQFLLALFGLRKTKTIESAK